MAKLTSFKAKNGQLELSKNGKIHIGRSGWFGMIYQFLCRTSTDFSINSVDDIMIKEPGIMRGYLSFKLRDGSKSTVWLTNVKMYGSAVFMKRVIEEMKQGIDVVALYGADK